MRISGLIKELQRMYEMHGDLTVTKHRNGEEINHVSVYGANQCLLYSDVDDIMDEIVRYTNNYGGLRSICNYIINQDLYDVINELKKNKDNFRIDIKNTRIKEDLFDKPLHNYPYLSLEIWDDGHKQSLKQIKKIHNEYDYCLEIIYHSTTDYGNKIYEFKVKPDIKKLYTIKKDL